MQKDLMKYFGENDRDTYKAIFDSLYPVMVLFARRILSDINNAEDITQEVFIELWQQRVKFESYNHIKSFLYLSIKNKCINFQKHQIVKDKYITVVDVNLNDFDEYVVEAEVINNLYNTISNLPEQQKQVINLSLQGFKNEEIAKELQISTNTVKYHKKAAYQQLRLQIGNSPLLLLLF